MPTHFLRNASMTFMHKYSCYPEEQGVTSLMPRSLNSVLTLHQNSWVAAEIGLTAVNIWRKSSVSFCYALAFLETVFLSVKLIQILFKNASVLHRLKFALQGHGKSKTQN